MINVLLPAMGINPFFKDSYFPMALYEIRGKTMLEMIVDNFKSLPENKMIFVLREEECIRFHLDDSAKMLRPDSHVIRLKSQTEGALCTCLMAIDYIDNDMPLIIANCDQIMDIEYQTAVDYFERNRFDIGVITFPNIHPRWSYARKDGNQVIEVAEKRPISKDAVAGFWYFQHGADFVQSAMNALRKQNHHQGAYYLSAGINEAILLEKRVGYYDIEKDKYHSFYSPAKIKEYEDRTR